MKSFVKHIALAAAVFLSVSSLHGQAVNAGDIRGIVTDTSGAVVPGVSVTVTNLATGVVKTLETNNGGLFDTSSIVVGTYSVKFEKAGFKSFDRSNVSIQVGFSTVNAVLAVGAASETVTVNTDIPLLATESGEQSTTFQAKDMSQLPNVGGGTGPDWQNFVILLPGSAGTPQGSNGGSNPGQVAAINGNLPYSNVLADGVSTTLSHSANSDVNTFETVAELQVNTSAFSAQYGIGGVVFNQISKGGTNKFHGTAYEYFQNDALNAAQYGFSSQPTIPFLRYNDFGGSIGGPVLIPHFFNGRDKAFFYFNYDQIINHGSASNSTQTIPTEAVKAGDFSGQHLIYDPTTQTMATDSQGNPYPIRKTFQEEYGSNAVPDALFDKVSAAFQKLYPTPANHIAGGKFLDGQLNGAGLLQNNWFSSLPQSTPYKRYFGRFDYNINNAHRLSMTDQQRDTPVVYPNSVSACPVGCQSGDVDSNTAQITESWTISPSIVNEVRFGYTYQGNFFADLTLGKGYPAQLGWQFSKADSLPAVQFNGSYPYAWINPSSNAVYKEHVFDPSDVVTMIKGKHVLHFGGEFLIYQDNSTAWGNTNAGTLQFNGAYTRNWTLDKNGVASPDTTTGLDYADFLLGAADSWGAGVSPEYAGRLKSPQVFVQDDYKVTPNLTVNVGLRYQIRRGWTEARGNMATFDPTVTNPADGSKGAFWYGTTKANGRNQLQANEYKTFLPRVGFSWLAHPTTTIRGGFGLYAYNLSLDTYGAGMGAEVSSSGGLSDQTNGITPITYFDGTGTNAQTGAALPYSAASTDPARFNGQDIGNYNPYHTPTPRIYQYNLSMQNAVGSNMVFEMAYVGSHAQNLNYPTDANAVPLNHLTTNNTAFRPYPLFNSIGTSSNDGISNYNSLQVSVSRRLTSGLSFDANYTWAHFTDSADSSSWGSRAGAQSYQIANNAAANYSNSNFDIHNAFKNRLVFQLPFGRGRKFMNKSWVLDEALGGWQVTTTNIIQSGNPFTVATGGDTYQHAGTQFPNYTGAPLYVNGKNHTVWFNPAAFSLPAQGTFGNVRRNALYGPGVNLTNLSVGKTFDIHENVKLQIRADATNAFNHANFGLPGGGVYGLTTFSGQQPGQAYRIADNTQQITGTTNGGRGMQLAAHLEF